MIINILMSFPYTTKKETVLYALINWFKVPQVTQTDKTSKNLTKRLHPQTFQ